MCQKGLLYFDVVHTVGQDQIDQLVAGVVGFGGQLVQLGQNLLPNADGDHPIAVLTLPLDDQRILLKELKREKYSLTDAEKITWLKKNCKADTYTDLARNPEANKGKYVKFTCYILQVVSDAADANHYSVYRAATKGRWDNVILLYIDNYGQGRLLEDDRVTIYGTFEGLYTYESVMGASITVPQVIANHYE